MFLGSWFVIPAFCLWYFLPTWWALKREEESEELQTTFLVNLLLGWTIIGWIMLMWRGWKSDQDVKAQYPHALHGKPEPTNEARSIPSFAQRIAWSVSNPMHLFEVASSEPPKKSLSTMIKMLVVLIGFSIVLSLWSAFSMSRSDKNDFAGALLRPDRSYPMPTKGSVVLAGLAALHFGPTMVAMEPVLSLVSALAILWAGRMFGCRYTFSDTIRSICNAKLPLYMTILASLGLTMITPLSGLSEIVSGAGVVWYSVLIVAGLARLSGNIWPKLLIPVGAGLIAPILLSAVLPKGVL